MVDEERVKPAAETIEVLSGGDRVFIGREIEGRYKEYRGNELRLSFAYFSSVIISALSSGLAALILQLNLFKDSPAYQKDIASSLAFLAALLVTVNTATGLNSKWKANRIARVKVQNLRLKLKRDNLDKEFFLDRLEEIEENRNGAVVA